ncbi:MAG: FKBP-type peptidyl-prolyl cis-trans isomerase [Candidatus Saccharibacteria bacterium]|nr:FKBP-type peptidyl-prolyl cis-trans isomerase [Candidatus Saccharibacteria bacterium]
MSKKKRMAIIFIAILFLATSVAFSVMVFVDISGNNDDSTRSVEDIASEQAQQNQGESEGDMLQGAKLQNFEPTAIEELRHETVEKGDGEVVSEDATITFHYTGALAEDGTIFQSSLDMGQPATFPLSDLIPGWQQGIPGMKVGETRRLFIPWQLGYGEQGSPQGGIPPQADLVFDIEVLSTE